MAWSGGSGWPGQRGRGGASQLSPPSQHPLIHNTLFTVPPLQHPSPSQQPPNPTPSDQGIRSMHGRYASNWNAYLFRKNSIVILNRDWPQPLRVLWVLIFNEH